ncbi:probable carboxylesterase 7 [Chenopodium quinoa]|uniref:Alpha/beta hydrolase fold-3 domain-containing protein n=1 Tax=Chenopodium quinoa TaxID=63459 RepID=A0A803N6N2_CHEQI|nr:probable carboxylesterase 7 [Chenopodium quinoa]
MSLNTNKSESEWNYSESDIAQKFLLFNVLKDGRVHVLTPPAESVPPSFGTTPDVLTKDVEISTEVFARISIPSSASTNACTTQKLPVVFYLQGGGFCKQYAFSEDSTRFGSDIAAEANVIFITIKYGIFPARPLPACYDDSWAALQWLASHSKGTTGPEPWINDYADLGRIFVGGNSAGGNICHTLLAKAGSMGLPGDAKVEGMILIHPYFGEDDKMWMYMCPTNEGPQDPRMKPAVEDLPRIVCGRVLVVLAEKDVLYGAGNMYAEELIKSGWKGTVEIMENKDKDHCFNFSNFMDLEAIAIRQRIASFIHNQS